MEHSEFANFLNERMRERGLNMRRLSEISGVSVKHLEAIFSGDQAHMPSYPYLKGYLSKLGEILDFNSDEAWEHMKKLSAPKSSGRADELPKNRFSKKPGSKYIAIGVILILLFIYGIFRFYDISGTPVVVVSSPKENMAVIAENAVSLAGHVSNSDELRINGELVQPQANGDWEKIFLLQPGINTLEITAKKFLGHETKVIRQVIYQPSTSTAPGTGQSGLPGQSQGTGF